MKSVLLALILAFAPAAAFAQLQPQIVSPSAAALQADGIVNMLGQSLEKAVVDNQALQKENADLQKQIAALKKEIAGLTAVKEAPNAK